jgi:hypothetical protein
VAAHGSNANSSVPGVIEGVGGFSGLSDRTEELREVERCLDNGPADMVARVYNAVALSVGPSPQLSTRRITRGNGID